ncbi:MAG: SGNH/GDSL hydrolase family protein [Phycisphaerae bacterium]
MAAPHSARADAPKPSDAAPRFAAVLGDWKMETRLGDDTIEATMSLSLKDGRLAGLWKSRGREMEMTDIRLEGNRLSFKRALSQEMTLAFDGTIRNTRIEGKYTGPMGDLICTGTRPEAKPEKAEAATGEGRVDLLNGKPRSFIVVGYSTSYAWPAMLQDMLDEHTGGKRVYHVLNAVVGGSPVAPWIARPGTRRYRATIGAMLRDYFGEKPRLRGVAPPPTVALCQQSLQFTGAPKGPIARIDDADGLKLGTDALEKLALRLREHGIEQVVIAMHIYKKGYEPRVGNERFALKALLARGHDFILEGPDVWSLTIGEHPAAFTEDGLHPNERGMKIMAEAWYRTLAGARADGKIIRRMHARSYDIDKIMRAYRKSRRVEETGESR